VIKVIKTNSV